MLRAQQSLSVLSDVKRLRRRSIRVSVLLLTGGARRGARTAQRGMLLLRQLQAERRAE